MLWVPTVKLLVLQVAIPGPLMATALQPVRVVLPSVKATLPVGAMPVTAAVKVTLVPTVAGLSELDSVVVVADGLFGFSYPPAGALISAGAEHVGLGQAYGFGLFNLAWAGGQVIGGAGSAGLAQVTSDAVPYSLLAALCLITVLAVARERRAVKAASG